MSHYRHVRGHFDDWIESFETGLGLCRQAGDRMGESFVLSTLGVPYGLREQYDRAITIYQDAVAVSRDIGNRSTE